MAFAKPTIAVLGLEVLDKSGTPTPSDTQVASELTSGLRARAKAGTGPYQIAAGSDKELIDEKLLKSCDDERPACMAAIGTELGAEFLMYGHIEKQGNAYQVTIVLLDVKKKARENAYPTSIPIAESSGAPLQGWAKKIYAKLIGQSECTIVVKTPGVDRGTILVDGAEKGNITNGQGQVTLTESKYRIAVEAQDYHRWEKSDVTCTATSATTLSADMQKNAGGDTGGGTTGGGTTGGGSTGGHENHEITGSVSHPGNTWKPVLIGGAVATGVFAIGFGYTWSELSKTGKKSDGFFQYGANCVDNGSGSVMPTNGATQGQCDAGGRNKVLTYVTGIASIAAAGVTILALVKTISGPANPEHAENGTRKHKPAIAITPVVSPNGAGATLQFDW